MLGILRKRTTCSCSEGSAHWSWPFTRAHEKYHGQIVTTVTCLKHAWSVRLYDEGKMRFATFAEEQEFMQRVQAPVPQSGRANAREAMPDMITAGV